MTVKYFNVKNGLSTGNISLDATSGNISGTNLSVTGNSNLGAIGNVQITGGSNGYFLKTDGNGNLSFTSPASTASPAPMPTYVPVGTDLSISANYQGIYSVPIVVDGSLTVDGVLVQVDGIVGSTNSQVIFNDYGTTTGNANLTFNKATGTLTTVALALSGTANLGAVGNVKITGGSSGQVLSTDGTGNLTWANGGSGGGTPGGTNTQVQFNDAGSFGANSGFTFNKTTGTFATPFIVTNGNGISNIQGANVSGQVSNALVAGTVTTNAQPNITSLGTLTTLGVTGNIDVTGNINVTGNLNYSNVTDLVVGDPLIYIGANNAGDLYDLGIVASYTSGTTQYTGIARNHTTDTWTFFDNVANDPTTVIDWANATYPNVKMGNLLSTANINASYFIGNGSALTYLTGANVTGAVAYATTANAVAGANVTGAVAYATTANSVAGSNVSGAVAYATTANSVAGANVSGAVSYATTANSVAVANVSGIGNISTVNLDGNSSNILYGNGSFASPPASGISTGKAIAMAIVFGF